MRNPSSLSPRLYFPIYSRRFNWYCACKFISGYCPSRHILCSSPFPLCPIYGSCIRNCCSFRTLIPPLYRLYITLYMNKNSLRGNIYWSKSYLLPPTLPWSCRYTSSILGLSRRLYPLKYSLLNWLSNFPSGRNYILIYYLRSIRLKT